MDIQQIARICYETNRAYRTSIGEPTGPPWEETPEKQRQGVVDGVRQAIEHPEGAAKTGHEAWLVAKRRDGWKFGPAIDPGKREHPAMVPYEDLSPEQRAKDVLFAAVARALVDA